MAIPKRKTQNDKEDSLMNDGTTEEMGEDMNTPDAKNFPPAPDKSPEENIADLGEELFGVRTIQDHKCVIGGVSYMFKAGERAMVPFNVKCILSRANLLRG